jgi:hypothetical protein
VSHDRVTQGSWTAIRHKGRNGFQWWVLTAHDASTDFTGDYHASAAHPTSPYAAYGASMATEDGYFLGRRLAGVDLTDHIAVRKAHQARSSS